MKNKSGQTTIVENYNHFCAIPSDIHEHLPTLKRYAEQCEHITEFGVRAVVSTWALLMGQPKTLRCFDIHKDNSINQAIEAADDFGIDMKFKEADVLKIEIEPTEMLFIDTLHTYTQLKKELELHSSKVSKFIAFHDVVTYGYKPEPASWQTPEIMKNYVQNDKGIMTAIEEFLEVNQDWQKIEFNTNNNGLLIIGKK
jgi:hypothetical protein